MNPSRELDALIATRVMRLKAVKISKGEAIELMNAPSEGRVAGKMAVIESRLEGVVFGDGGQQDIIPPYSTSIEAALEVVGCVRRKNRLFDFELYNYGDNEWTATFVTDKRHHGYGDSAPHAICLAALKAVGYSQDR